MPNIPGTEVTQKLRSMGISPDVPLIVTIALDEIDAQAITDSLDAVAVLNKPFRITAMVESPTTVLNAFPQNPLPIVRIA
jgi:CheY-like chemotaxis protein